MVEKFSVINQPELGPPATDVGTDPNVDMDVDSTDDEDIS
jgi:hypothetical protein